MSNPQGAIDGGGGGAGGGGSSANVKIAAFNVLAPCWASPSYYPTTCAPLLAPWQTRINRCTTFVKKTFLDVDVITFQETEATINPTLAAALGNGFQVYHAFHDDDYWSKWVTTDPPFARNGVSIGVSKTKYDQMSFKDIALGTGCHAGVVTCRHITVNRWFRFVSCHFDSDSGGRRGKEAQTLVETLDADKTRPYVDVIAGDLNADSKVGVIKSRITDNGFLDVLRAMGIEENTSPYSTSSNGNSMWGNIDHIMVRGERFNAVAAKIHSFNLWTTFPVLGGQPGIENENLRITKNMELTGSDHFAVEGVFSVSL